LLSNGGDFALDLASLGLIDLGAPFGEVPLVGCDGLADALQPHLAEAHVGE
jgi:hypothetical protein